MTIDVPTAWALIIGFALTMYVILDGFDLGVGILLIGARTEDDRNLMVKSIEPVWDGNETWLVLVGVGLLGGFPAAYGIALPAFYLPVIMMLLCLALRGTAFEFRLQTQKRRRLWDIAFAVGSWGTALCQGLIIGALLVGIRVQNLSFAGSVLDCLRPFGMLTALLVTSAYALLGSTWLTFRTAGTLSIYSRMRAQRSNWAFVVLVGAVVGAAPWAAPELMAHSVLWGRVSVALFLAALMTLSALLRQSLSQKRDYIPFAYATAMVWLVLGAFIYTLWPYLIPYEVTFRDAASVEHSQVVLLFGALFILPFVLAYTSYSYFVFRGKVAPEPPQIETPVSDGGL